MALTATPAPGTGKFTLEVIEAKELKKSLRESTNPFVKITFGAVEKTGRVLQGTENPKWNERFELPTTKTKESLRIQVWDFQGGLNDLLGEFKMDVGGRHPEGERWVVLQPTPSGEIFLRWNYQYTPKPDERPAMRSPSTSVSFSSPPPAAGAGAVGEPDPPAAEPLALLNLEIVKAKKLQVAQFAETVSPIVTFVCAGQEKQTKVKRRTTDPFWNETFDMPIDDPQLTLTFQVNDDDDKNRLIGSASLTLQFEADGKGSEWLPLTRDDASSGLGEIMIRYKITCKKKKPKKGSKAGQQDEDDIDLGYEPKINGAVGVIPDRRLYIWFQLFEDDDFRDALTQKLLQSYFRRERAKVTPGLAAGPPGWIDVPYSSVDEIVEECWKVQTRLQLFTKLRLAGQQFKQTGTCIVPAEEEQKLRFRWKESSIMMGEIATSFKIEKSIKSLWNMFAYGADDPNPEAKRGVDTRINKKTYIILCTHIYCTCVPDLSKKLAKKIATEDWARGDQQQAEHIDESHLFVLFVKELAAFWCDTLTEYEYQTFLTTLLPILLKARREWIKPSSPSKRRKSKPMTTSVDQSVWDEEGKRVPAKKGRPKSREGGTKLPATPGSAKSRPKSDGEKRKSSAGTRNSIPSIGLPAASPSASQQQSARSARSSTVDEHLPPAVSPRGRKSLSAS
eukprot:TRINITY_DN20982_c0_g1_i1.p1 TRINITY_DN20982_c0_g1~~TRINITY_DN20982_c0_g1_i1.p1  ORF type:complete len:690 (+),score=96.22 TRINITY_DN20982_c0_g1_i1:44-2071(+)